jgi:hypothetical protein
MKEVLDSKDSKTHFVEYLALNRCKFLVELYNNESDSFYSSLAFVALRIVESEQICKRRIPPGSSLNEFDALHIFR